MSPRGIDRPGLDYVIVMEDLALRGADPRDATRPLTIEQTANGVRSLAAPHSAFWGFSGATRPALAWVQTWEPTEGFQSGLRRRVPTGLERAAGVLPDEVARYDGDEIVDLWVRFVSSLTTGSMTLLHADLHIGNTYVLPDDEVGFLDWEVTRRGNWSQDLGYFVIGALPEADRRSSQERPPGLGRGCRFFPNPCPEWRGRDSGPAVVAAAHAAGFLLLAAPRRASAQEPGTGDPDRVRRRSVPPSGHHQTQRHRQLHP